MYEAYWQLHSRPFDVCGGDARFYYPSEVHQGALLKLRYAIENGRGAALLCGPSGSGKSLMVNILRRQLTDRCSPIAHVVFPQMSHRELLSYLAEELGAALPGLPTGSVDESVRRLKTFLEENTRRGKQAVLVIDEAQLLVESGGLETIRLLLNFESDGRGDLTLVLVGQAGLLPALDRMPGLEERLGVKCLLRSFSFEETIGYVSHRMIAAGAVRDVFTQDALSALHHLAGGNPRRLNRLCDLALLIGYAEEQPAIAAAQIEAVSNELVSVAPE